MDAEAAAKLAAPLQAYPRWVMTAYNAWFEMGTKLVMGSLSTNQRLLRALNDQWTTHDGQSVAALQTAMFETAREVVARPIEIITQFQQRLLGGCEAMGSGEAQVVTPSSVTSTSRGTGGPTAMQRERQTTGVKP